jgi:tRNA nucleotidyltransferase (CCA-adding enzyme)
MVRLGEHAEGALILGRMCRPDRAADYEKALDRMKVIGARGDCLTLRDLAVDGKTLMDELGLGGRAVGAMLATLLNAVLDDPALNDRATLLSLARAAEKR